MPLGAGRALLLSPGPSYWAVFINIDWARHGRCPWAEGETIGYSKVPRAKRASSLAPRQNRQRAIPVPWRGRTELIFPCLTRFPKFISNNKAINGKRFFFNKKTFFLRL